MASAPTKQEICAALTQVINASFVFAAQPEYANLRSTLFAIKLEFCDKNSSKNLTLLIEKLKNISLIHMVGGGDELLSSLIAYNKASSSTPKTLSLCEKLLKHKIQLSVISSNSAPDSMNRMRFNVFNDLAKYLCEKTPSSLDAEVLHQLIQKCMAYGIDQYTDGVFDDIFNEYQRVCFDDIVQKMRIAEQTLIDQRNNAMLPQDWFDLQTKVLEDAVLYCSYTHIQLNEITKSPTNFTFRKEFEAILPYPTSYKVKTIPEVLQSVFQNIPANSTDPIEKECRILTRAIDRAINLHKMPHSTLTQLLKLLAYKYSIYANAKNQNRLRAVFELFGQMLVSITNVGQPSVSWWDVLTPKTQINMITPTTAELPQYLNQKSLLISEVSRYPGFFTQTSFTQAQLNAFAQSISNATKLNIRANTPIGASEKNLKSVIAKPQQATPVDTTPKTPIDTTPKIVTTDDSKSTFASTPTVIEDEVLVDEKKVWYKTTMGVVGICVGVAVLGGGIYFIQRKK